MTLPSRVRPRTLLILTMILVVFAFFAWTAYQFDQVTRQSIRHDYFYSIDLSYNTTITNVTFIVPLPELNTTPLFIESLVNGTAYGIPPDWNITIVSENRSPMLAIRADRMVPEYNGYPIAIEPGASVLPTTLRPGHEYSGETPVLVPVNIAIMNGSAGNIETRQPFGREPLFFPGGAFSPGSCTLPSCDGAVYDHLVPVYIRYTSGGTVSVSLRVSVQGTNAIWRGGWVSDSYSDTVFIEVANDTQGWIEAEGKVLTALSARTPS
jgi:hypothetical protein